jgi:hypothetical protein
MESSNSPVPKDFANIVDLHFAQTSLFQDFLLGLNSFNGLGFCHDGFHSHLNIDPLDKFLILCHGLCATSVDGFPGKAKGFQSLFVGAPTRRQTGYREQ